MVRTKRVLSELGGGAVLAAVLLLVLNDHAFKGRLPGALTGKLSDVAICFLLPLFVATVLGVLTRLSLRPRLITGAVIGGATFALVEMSDGAGAIYTAGISMLGLPAPTLTRDPTDLWTLFCVPLAVAYGLFRASQSSPPWARARGLFSLMAGSLALAAEYQPQCDKGGPEAFAFLAEPGCGEGGVFVIEPQYTNGALFFVNAEVLGLPNSGSTQVVGPFSQYSGRSCPFTPERGEWTVQVDYCSVSPAADGGFIEVCPPTYRRCAAALEGGELWFTCRVPHLGNGAAPAPPARGLAGVLDGGPAVVGDANGDVESTASRDAPAPDAQIIDAGNESSRPPPPPTSTEIEICRSRLKVFP